MWTRLNHIRSSIRDKFVVVKTRIFHENILFHRRIFISSSNFFLIVASLVSVNFTFIIRTIYRFLSWSIRVNLMLITFTFIIRHVILIDYSTSFAIFVHRFSTYSSRSFIITRDFHSWSLIVIRRSRHDHLSIFETSFTIAHCHSTYSSKSLIVTREFFSRSFDVINDRSILIEVAKNKFIEAREDFKKKVLSRFQTKDLFVRFVSTRYESRHSNTLRLSFSIYILQHVSSHSIASILVHSTHTSIYSLFMLMLWHKLRISFLNNNSFLKLYLCER